MENTAFEGLNIKEKENITKILDLKLNILVLPSLTIPLIRCYQWQD